VIDVVAVRRDLHAHPELAFLETRTTKVILDGLAALGLPAASLPGGTGVVCDIGDSGAGPTIALRADIDALPLPDQKTVDYRSTVPGVCHGCGHDAHVAILLAAAAQLCAQPLPGRVRLVFQPAEETVPGGALSVIAAGVLDDVERIFALHCDPRLMTGEIGVRVGPITAACDQVDIEVIGPGGHTARPHLTVDLIYAMGRLITELPGLFSRLVDPRAMVSVVWGTVGAGRASNAIPAEGHLSGTLRVFDREAWDDLEPLTRSLVEQILAPSGAKASITYTRGVPPVVNDAASVALQRAAVISALGDDALTSTEQSMGGEDFAWYLDEVPGALARLGVRRRGQAPFDLHQGTFDIDEDALPLGVRYTVELARSALVTLAAG
jgi:amidohydrolase